LEERGGGAVIGGEWEAKAVIFGSIGPRRKALGMKARRERDRRKEGEGRAAH